MKIPTIRLIGRDGFLSPRVESHHVILFQIMHLKLLILKINKKFEIHMFKIDHSTISKATWGIAQFEVPYKIGWVSGCGMGKLHKKLNQFRILTKYLTIKKKSNQYEITFKMSLL